MSKKKDISHKQALEALETLSKQVKKETRAREKAEKSLKALEAQHQFLADNQPAMIWGSGTDKLCNYFNKVWLDFTGRTLERELGNGWAEGVHPDDLERCLKIYIEAFDLRQVFKMEYRLRKADGSYAWISDHGVPHYSPDGDFLGYMGTCIDISEPKLQAETLKTQEDQYRSLFEMSSDAIMLLTKEGFFDCNIRTLEIFRCKNKPEFVAHHPADFSPPFQPDGRDSFSAAKEQISIALRRGNVSFQWTHRRKDGKDFPAEVSLSSIDYCGTRVLQAIVRDLSEKKETEEDIKKKTTYFQLLQDVTETTNSAKGLEEAVRNCLGLICRSIGWPVGHAYRLQSFDFASCLIAASTSAGDIQLVSTRLWHLDDPEKFKTFKEITEKTSFSIGLGLPGWVLASRRPKWVFNPNSEVEV